MKKCRLLLNIILIIILVLAVGWYLFGQDGPFGGGDNVDTEDATKQENIETEVETEEQEENQNKETVEEPVTTETSVVFTGDVEISEYVQANYDDNGIDGVADEDIQSLLKDASITMINNEFCFSERGEQAEDKQYTFRVNPSYVSILTDLGVDIAGLANNHVLDFGTDALLDTFSTLKGAEIDYTGAGNSFEEASGLIIKTDETGRTFGFLAASHVIPVYSWDVTSNTPGEFTFYDETNLINAVESAASQVDYLFVMVHWGVEHTTELEDYQVTDGHKLIDAGADAVIGMHSHCLQPVEIYEGKPIFYSLGNFIFNNSISSGGAAEIIADKDGNLTYKIIPIIAEGAKTRLATENDPDYLDYIEGISENIVIDDEGFITSK